MARLLCFLIAALLVSSNATRAADKAPAGNWKIMLPLNPAARGGADLPLWLLGVEEKDGAFTGKIVASHEGVGKTEVLGLTVKEGVLRFTLRAGDDRIGFEGKLPEGEGTKVYGTIAIGQTITPAVLEKTTLASLDKNEVNKDILLNSKDNAAIIKAGMNLVGQAGFLKAKPDDVRAWVDRSLKASEAFGERWKREVILTLVETLNEQDGMAQVALPYARLAGRMLIEKDRPAMQKRTLELLASALDRAGKADEAKEVTARVGKIDLTVRTQTYPGRDAKNNRVVLFELFTGAECPPCIAADLGFDGLLKTFKPSDVILLQYHEHIPGPDPLSNEQTLARMKYYAEAFGREVGGTPASILNGTPTAGGGGGKDRGQDKYDAYYDAILSKLDEAAKVKLAATVKRNGDKIDIEADVSELKDPGASIKLRLVLIEDVVEYKGGNGLEKHHHVVRAFPGGVEGTALKEKSLKHKASVDLGDLRKELTKYLTDFYKKAEEELPKNVPMEFKNLKVVALVQDDNTREVLHAIQVDVENK